MSNVELSNRGSGGASSETDNLLLKVRTKEGSELDLILRRGGLVDDLKQEIIRRLELVDKNVRLIFSGKLLDPPTAPLNSFKLNNGSFIHAVITNKQPLLPPSERPESPQARITVDLSNLRGFDVLLVPGPHRNSLTIEEVGMLRLYFQEELAEYANENMLRQPNESEEDFVYRAETEWAASQGPRSEFRLNIFGGRSSSSSGLQGIADDPTSALLSSTGGGARALRQAFESEANNTPDPDAGTFKEFFYGFLMGFALGFMMIFCVWDRNVSHKQKLGILTGVLVQLLFTVMQQEQVNAKNRAGELNQNMNNGNLGITVPGPPPVSVVDESSR